MVTGVGVYCFKSCVDNLISAGLIPRSLLCRVE